MSAKASLEISDKASSIKTSNSGGSKDSKGSTAVDSIQQRPSGEAPSISTVATGSTGTTTTSTLSTSTGTTSSTIPEEDLGPPTFFTTISKSYADVTISDEGVDTIGFLEASDGVLALFDLLGSTAFGIVINDMNGNINKIRTRFLAAPLQSTTLESLVKNETADKKSKKTATEGLLWLIRGLQFTCIALRRSQNDHEEELSKSFTEAYGLSLKKYHSFVVKPLFAIAMKACPYRRDFYEKLGPEEAVNIELGVWLNGLQEIVERMLAFYEKEKNFGL